MAKDIFGQLKERLNGLMDSTNKAIETGKLQIEIQQLKQKISGIQKSVGKHVVDRHIAGDLIVSLDDEAIATKLRDIAFYKEKIKELEQKVGEAK